MENNRRCELRNIDVHRASMQKHLESEKHIKNKKQNEMIITDKQAPIKNKITKVYNPKTLKQIARENIKINDEEMAKKMFNP